MITNEECRETAKELRKLADSPYSSDDVRSDVRIEDVCYELGLERGFHDDCVDPESVKHLADLIDRPTCKNAKLYKDVFECSECHCSLELITEVCNEYDEPFSVPFMPTFCPGCGAEVIE